MDTKAAAFTALVLASLFAACGNDSQSTTAPSSTAATATTSTFMSLFTPTGATARTFKVSQAGTVSVTLTSAGPPATIVVGLGVGIPAANGAGCSLATSVNTAAGASAQLTIAVDPGDYCLQVYDVGNATEPVGFTITLVHP